MADGKNNILDGVSSGAKLLRSNPACREVLRWTLLRCRGEMVSLAGLESEIAALPQYGDGCPEPYFVAQWLVDAGCLDFFEVDANGVPVDCAAMRDAGASEDDIDDAIAGYAYRTNEAGCAIANSFSPETRVEKLCADHPDIKSALLDVLLFLKSGHSLGEVSSHVAQSTSSGLSQASANPIALVNKLSDAGAISFVNHRWKTTEEGMAFLQNEIGK